MSVAFKQGETIGRGDLDIFLSNSNGNVANAYEISFALYFVDPVSSAEVLIGGAQRQPMNPSVGEYYAALAIPRSSTIGDYRIRWTFKEFAASPFQQVVQEFNVVGETVITTTEKFTQHERDMIHKLRILLRDQNPDKFYHFRPPEHEGSIGKYNQVFGYIWEDEELLEYLERSLDWWNMMPPETEMLSDMDRLVKSKPAWRTAILWGAIIHAATALAFNWTADEFDYSIGGVSLSIEKSSKYESLKSNAEGQLQLATEAKARTTKYMRSLTQPRFGRGVRSAFGPHVGAGVLSPRKFV